MTQGPPTTWTGVITVGLAINILAFLLIKVGDTFITRLSATARARAAVSATKREARIKRLMISPSLRALNAVVCASLTAMDLALLIAMGYPDKRIGIFPPNPPEVEIAVQLFGVVLIFAVAVLIIRRVSELMAALARMAQIEDLVS